MIKQHLNIGSLRARAGMTKMASVVGVIHYFRQRASARMVTPAVESYCEQAESHCLDHLTDFYEDDNY